MWCVIPQPTIWFAEIRPVWTFNVPWSWNTSLFHLFRFTAVVNSVFVTLLLVNIGAAVTQMYPILSQTSLVCSALQSCRVVTKLLLSCGQQISRIQKEPSGTFFVIFRFQIWLKCLKEHRNGLDNVRIIEGDIHIRCYMTAERLCGHRVLHDTREASSGYEQFWGSNLLLENATSARSLMQPPRVLTGRVLHNCSVSPKNRCVGRSGRAELCRPTYALHYRPLVCRTPENQRPCL